MEQRFEFVLQRAKHETSMAELCRTFGISRQTGYGLVTHFLAEGLGGLKPHSVRHGITPIPSPRSVWRCCVPRRLIKVGVTKSSSRCATNWTASNLSGQRPAR